MCYASDVCHEKINSTIESHCALCGFNFPFKNIIVCNYGHHYHAWCAIVWFKKTTRCKDNLCEGLVHPNWYKSFGFVEFDNQLEDKYVDLECEFT